VAEIFENYSIKNESTFKIGGTVKKAAFPVNVEEFIRLLESDEYDYVLGSCSNVLFSSQKIDKSFIITKKVNEYKINGNKIYVSAGTLGAVVSRACLEHNLTGFEFLIGFPGSFGGMIYMNASAHNQAVSDNFICANVFNKRTKQTQILYKDDMNFSYRHSKITESEYIILSAEFELKEGNHEQIEELMKRNTEFRRTRQPSLKYGNAGSVFKNPSNDSAGRLLDLCNLKGEKEGGAMVSTEHANFIINLNNATSEDVLTLMYKMYLNVKEKYTIELRPEIKYIGDEKTKEYRLWRILNSENMETIQK